MSYNTFKTAITRNRPSLPARYLKSQGLLKGKMLDYGCGKGLDAKCYDMDKYDPYYAPKRNQRGKYDIITCTYVLCVLSKSKQKMVIENIRNLLRKNGVAYISVRRDLKEPKGDQRIVNLNLPIIKETSGYCIYKLI